MLYNHKMKPFPGLYHKLVLVYGFLSIYLLLSRYTSCGKVEGTYGWCNASYLVIISLLQLGISDNETVSKYRIDVL
jgi:hypothetical protein